MTRTYWLSFVEPGVEFLGVAVVDVDEDDLAEAKERLRNLATMDGRPLNADDNAGWVLAATMVARQMGCNPGGEVMSLDVTKNPPVVPRNRLLSKADLVAFGHDNPC